MEEDTQISEYNTLPSHSHCISALAGLETHNNLQARAHRTAMCNESAKINRPLWQFN